MPFWLHTAFTLAALARCPDRPQRPRGVLLAYTWGSGPSSCSPYFVRSWAALPPEERAFTDLVILWEGSESPCGGEPVGDGPMAARYVKMPADVLAPLKETRLSPAAYRMRAINWWLDQPEGVGYGYVGVLDTDMLFQSDVFDAIHPLVHTSHELHLVSENPAERNQGYTTKRLRDRACDRALTRFLVNASILPRYDPNASTSTSTPYLAGRRLSRSTHRMQHASAQLAPIAEPSALEVFWTRFGGTHRLNFGSMFGTRDAMMALCELVVSVLIGPMSACWDREPRAPEPRDHHDIPS